MSSLRYYRLKIIQKGGAFIYSGIISLNVKGMDIQVRPNPFDNELYIQLQTKVSETIRIELADMYGRTVYTTSEQINSGNDFIRISVPPGMAKGMYVLEITAGNNHVFTKKLLKK